MRICSVCAAENADSAERCQCGAWLSSDPVTDRPAPSRGRPAAGPELPPADTFEGRILHLLKQGQKIPAIKLYREETGVGLKEAKDAVEALGRQYGMKCEGSGCGAAVLVACFAIAATAVVVGSLWAS